MAVWLFSSTKSMRHVWSGWVVEFLWAKYIEQSILVGRDKMGIVRVIKSRRITQNVSNFSALLCLLQVLDERCCKIRRFMVHANAISVEAQFIKSFQWSMYGICVRIFAFSDKEWNRTFLLCPEMSRKWGRGGGGTENALIEFYFRSWIFSSTRTIWQSIKSPSNRNGINSMLMTANYDTKRHRGVLRELEVLAEMKGKGRPWHRWNERRLAFWPTSVQMRYINMRWSRLFNFHVV